MLPILFVGWIMRSTALIASCSVSVLAWWDYGHMVVANIARQRMNVEDVKFYETILHALDADFPGMGTMEPAAVWLDHIKCSDGINEGCKQSDTYDGNNLFFTAHFASVPYNPSGKRSNSIKDIAYFSSIKSTIPIDHLSQAISGLATKPDSSVFSANQFIRSTLHIVGDLHQPLHTFSSICRFFNPKNIIPKPSNLEKLVVDEYDMETELPRSGDQGGNYITVQHEDLPGETNLHAVWDAAGGVFNNTNYPFITLREIEESANDILNEYGAEVESGNYEPLYLDKMLEGILTNRRDMTVMERWLRISFDSLTDSVYSEIIDSCETGRKFDEDPYRPSDAYLQMVKEVSKKRIALAGIRMAELLTQILKKRKEIINEKFDGVDNTFRRAQEAIRHQNGGALQHASLLGESAPESSSPDASSDSSLKSMSCFMALTFMVCLVAFVVTLFIIQKRQKEEVRILTEEVERLRILETSSSSFNDAISSDSLSALLIKN